MSGIFPVVSEVARHAHHLLYKDLIDIFYFFLRMKALINATIIPIGNTSM